MLQITSFLKLALQPLLWLGRFIYILDSLNSSYFELVSWVLALDATELVSQMAVELIKNYLISAGICQSLKIWGAYSNAARHRCRRRLLICQKLGGRTLPLPPRLRHACTERQKNWPFSRPFHPVLS